MPDKTLRLAARQQLPLALTALPGHRAGTGEGGPDHQDCRGGSSDRGRAALGRPSAGRCSPRGTRGPAASVEPARTWGRTLAGAPEGKVPSSWKSEGGRGGSGGRPSPVRTQKGPCPRRPGLPLAPHPAAGGWAICLPPGCGRAPLQNNTVCLSGEHNYADAPDRCSLAQNPFFSPGLPLVSPGGVPAPSATPHSQLPALSPRVLHSVVSGSVHPLPGHHRAPSTRNTGPSPLLPSLPPSLPCLCLAAWLVRSRWGLQRLLLEAPVGEVSAAATVHTSQPRRAPGPRTRCSQTVSLGHARMLLLHAEGKEASDLRLSLHRDAWPGREPGNRGRPGRRESDQKT